MTSTSGNADANESTPGSSAWAPRRDGSTQQPETSAATDHTGASGSAESSDPPAGNATQPIQSRLGTEQPATGTQPQPAGTRQSRLAKRALIGLLAGALALLALLVLVNPLSWLRDQIFGTEDPPVAGDVTLLEIKDTAELKVATGTFSVPVYFRAGEQSGIRRRIPDFIDGNSGVAIYQGSVDATIDLRGLTEGDIDADRNRRTLVIRVSPPVLSDPNIDEENSMVVAHNRGLGTRLEDFLSTNPLQRREPLDDEGVAALREAARQSALEDNARRNGEQFLTKLGNQLGYDKVTVEFTEPPQ